MNFLRLLSVLSLIIFCLASCGPDQKNSTTPAGDDRADAASFAALVGPKWCLAPNGTGRSAFVLSWNFRDDGIAYLTKTKVDNRQIIFNQKKKWTMRTKTLRVFEEASGVELLKKEISFAMDLNTGSQVMTWSDSAKPADCGANGTCSSTPVQAMTLTECE